MDEFDDLLAPSRRALEENPFADPFATARSGSPDPWATPFANTQSADDYGESSAISAGDSYSAAADTDESTSSSAFIPSDPLESAIQDEDHHDHRTASPGFRESVEPTVRTTEPEEQQSTSPPPIEKLYSQTPAATAETPRASTPSSPTSSRGRDATQSPGTRILSPSPSASKTDFISPLEQKSKPFGINQSIAGLSLGGESLGGWQSEQGAWGGQAEDDSDDDKPISQTVRLPEYGDDKPASLHASVVFFALNKLFQTQTTSIRDGNGICPVFVITVDDPQKVGDPIRSFTMYTVHTRVRADIISLVSSYDVFLRQHHRCSKNLLSPFCDVIQISYGCTRRFLLTTQESWSHQFRRRTLSDDLTTSLYVNAGSLWRNASRKSQTIRYWAEIRTSGCS